LTVRPSSSIPGAELAAAGQDSSGPARDALAVRDAAWKGMRRRARE
jgi:hypothetical protein